MQEDYPQAVLLMEEEKEGLEGQAGLGEVQTEDQEQE